MSTMSTTPRPAGTGQRLAAPAPALQTSSRTRTERTVSFAPVTPLLPSRHLTSSANATIDTNSAQIPKPTRVSRRCARADAPLAIVARSA